MVEKMKRFYKGFCKVCYVSGAVAVVLWGILTVKSYVDERAFLMSLYSCAVGEFMENCEGYNIQTGAYKKEYVNEQTMEFHDFGQGELRYNKYAVTVPVEYDTTFAHHKYDITIVVYYYQPWNMESVGKTPNPEIEPHIYVEDMFADLRKLFE